MNYEDMVTSLLKFKLKLRTYEKTLVDISISLIKEEPDSWISNKMVNYQDKETELQYLLEYFRKQDDVLNWEYIREIQKKLYDSN